MRTHRRSRRARAVGAGVAVAGLLAAGYAMTVAAAPHGEPDGATRLYVAPWGDDDWPGTAERPFATPAGAQREVRERTAGMDEDIVVSLRGGTYRLAEPLRFSAAEGDGGTGGHRVVYQAYGYGTPHQEPVTLSGGRAVTGWRPAADGPEGVPEGVAEGVWRADVGDLETRQLFVDGRRAERTALGGGLPGEAIRMPEGYATRSTAPQSWQRPEDMELVFNGGEEGLPYSEARCGVGGIAGDAEWTMIRVDQPCFDDLAEMYDNEVEGSVPPAPTDVENSLSLLREPGTWYLDRSEPGHHVLYYLPRPGEDPRHVPVVAPALQTLVRGEGTADAPLRDMAFRGLTFSHATWLAPDEPTGFPQIIGSWYWTGGALARMPGHVTFHRAERITVEGNRFTRLGGQALTLSAVGPGNTVRGNAVADVSGGGVEVHGSGAGNRVVDNRVRRVGTDYRSSIGIVLEGPPDSTVAHNQVNDVPYTGIWGESPRGLRVVGNLVFDAVTEVPDGGGIYLPFAQGTSFDDGAVVRGNVVHHATGVGLYPDVGADWVALERNVLYGSEYAVSGVEPGRITIADNYWDNGEPYWWPEDTPTDGVTLTGNTLLPRADAAAEAACRADPACAGILADAGPRLSAP
ncbi:right-handed parallel beta-helix repeat-containing protein [Streptomyces sp. 6N223]|uniref:right-handed parallel beta-helix repeat-containing protein n=1 Tax=Streptomyces sp. 6N223 TaxID=3457412 RepID=UPI003FD27F4C